jgi:dephospho-CoA kinase
MKLPEIVGVAGTNAAGKDTLGELRQSLQHAKFVSLSDILRRELDKRGLTHERHNLRTLSKEWRDEGGSGILAVKSIALYEEEKAAEGYSGLTLTSIRHPDEAAAIQKAGGIVIWVDADPKIRYQRILKRNLGRPEDQKTYEQFIDEENAEMHLSEAGGGLDMAGVRDVADLKIINEFDSSEAYEAYLRQEFELG